MLIDASVNVNAVDKQGFSALHYAVNHDYTLLALLLARGADPHLQSRNCGTALHLAIPLNSETKRF
jgi:ankyrin repeat protein